MIDYYQNKVECFSKTLCTVNNINQLLKELTEFNKDFQDSEYHNIFFQKLINNYSEFSKIEFTPVRIERAKPRFFLFTTTSRVLNPRMLLAISTD